MGPIDQLRKEIAQEEECIRRCEAELANDHFLRHFLVPGASPNNYELQSALRRFSFTKASNPTPNHYVLSGFFPDYSSLRAEIDIADFGDDTFALRCCLHWEESTYFNWLNFETSSTKTLHHSLNVWIERVANYLEFDRQRRQLVAHPQVETQHEEAFTVIQIPIVPQTQPQVATALVANPTGALKSEEDATAPLVVTWQFGGILRLAEAHPGLSQTDLDLLVATCGNDVEQALDLIITQCTGTFKEERLDMAPLDEKYRLSPSGRRRSDYEVLRCSRMERNETVLQRLGLGGATGEVIVDGPGIMSAASIAEAAMNQEAKQRKKATPKKPRTPKAKKGKKAPPKSAQEPGTAQDGDTQQETATQAPPDASGELKTQEMNKEEATVVAAVVAAMEAEEQVAMDTSPAPPATEEATPMKRPPRKRVKDSPSEEQPKPKKRQTTQVTQPQEVEAEPPTDAPTLQPTVEVQGDDQMNGQEPQKKDGRMTLRTSGRRLPKQSVDGAAVKNRSNEAQDAPPGTLSLKKSASDTANEDEMDTGKGGSPGKRNEKKVSTPTRSTRKSRGQGGEYTSERLNLIFFSLPIQGDAAAKSLLQLADSATQHPERRSTRSAAKAKKNGDTTDDDIDPHRTFV